MSERKPLIEREQWQMVLALVLVAMMATLILGLVDMATQEPIAKAQREALHKALVQVLPEHSNDPLVDVRMLEGNATVFHLAKDTTGRIVAVAWETIAPDGYSGSIRILMGVAPNGLIHAIRVTGHKETPGLGDAVTSNMVWVNSFINATLNNTHWAVKKDGGDFDQFTGATITPRAVVKAVKKGLELFQDSRDLLLIKDEFTAENAKNAEGKDDN